MLQRVKGLLLFQISTGLSFGDLWSDCAIKETEVGKVQVEGEVIHVIVQRCTNMTGFFDRIPTSTKSEIILSRKTETEKKVLPKGRDFH